MSFIYVWKVMKYSPMTYPPSHEPQNDNKNSLRSKIFIVNWFGTLRTVWLIPLKISWALLRSKISTDSSSGVCGCLSVCKQHVCVSVETCRHCCLHLQTWLLLQSYHSKVVNHHLNVKEESSSPHHSMFLDSALQTENVSVGGVQFL